jgi:hypothetical protein
MSRTHPHSSPAKVNVHAEDNQITDFDRQMAKLAVGSDSSHTIVPTNSSLSIASSSLTDFFGIDNNGPLENNGSTTMDNNGSLAPKPQRKRCRITSEDDAEAGPSNRPDDVDPAAPNVPRPAWIPREQERTPPYVYAEPESWESIVDKELLINKESGPSIPGSATQCYKLLRNAESRQTRLKAQLHAYTRYANTGITPKSYAVDCQPPTGYGDKAFLAK